MLGDRPPERVFARLRDRWAARDLDAITDTWTDDHVIVDHRTVGWDEAHGRDVTRENIRAIPRMFPEFGVEPHEVLACDDRILAVRGVVRGTGAVGGGDFEIAIGFVLVAADGRFERLEQYEYEDTALMLARYAELGGRRELRGDRPPERILAEYHRRFNERELDRVLELFPPDYLLVDHRAVGWGETTRGEIVPRHESLFALASDARFEVDEVLACDDRVIAATQAVRGTANDSGGSFEIAFGIVAVVENGLWIREDAYEPEDRQAMLARFAELGGGQGPLGDRPPARPLAESCRRFAAGDSDGMLACYAEDWLLVDHRTLGWGEMRKHDLPQLFETIFAAGSDWWLEVDEVLACDDRVIAVSITYHATGNDGGGAADIAWGVVMLVEDGLRSREFLYEPEEREAMLVRFAELGGGLIHRQEHFEYDETVARLARFAELGGAPGVLGDRPSERVGARLCRRWTAADLDELTALFAHDIVRVDHRTLGYDEMHGIDCVREHYRSMQETSPELCIEPEEVLARDDRVLMLWATVRGTAREGGGEFATPCGYLLVVAADRIHRLEQFEPDDRQAMVTRYTELGGGLGPLGDKPPERWWLEWARRVAGRDLDRFLELLFDDFRIADHQKLGWPEEDRAGVRSVMESLWSASLDLRIEVDEVLACHDRVLTLFGAIRATASTAAVPSRSPPPTSTWLRTACYSGSSASSPATGRPPSRATPSSPVPGAARRSASSSRYAAEARPVTLTGSPN